MLPPVDPEREVLDQYITPDNLLDYCRASDKLYYDVKQARDTQKYARWAKKALSRAHVSNGPRDDHARENGLKFAVQRDDEAEEYTEPDYVGPDRIQYALPDAAMKKQRCQEAKYKASMYHRETRRPRNGVAAKRVTGPNHAECENGALGGGRLIRIVKGNENPKSIEYIGGKGKTPWNEEK